MINEFAPKAVQTKLHRLEALLTEAKLLSNEIESDVVAIAAERGVDHAIAVHVARERQTKHCSENDQVGAHARLREPIGLAQKRGDAGDGTKHGFPANYSPQEKAKR